MEVLIRDGGDLIIADRKAKGLDKYDEVHHGVYVVMNLPGSPHQRRVADALVWFHSRGIACVPGVNVGEPNNFRGPDVAAWFNGYDDAVWFDHDTAPDLVVEVVSPSNSTTEMLERKSHFEAHGVKVYVEVAQDGSLTVATFAVLTEAQQAIVDELSETTFSK